MAKLAGDHCGLAVYSTCGRSTALLKRCQCARENKHIVSKHGGHTALRQAFACQSFCQVQNIHGADSHKHKQLHDIICCMLCNLILDCAPLVQTGPSDGCSLTPRTPDPARSRTSCRVSLDPRGHFAAACVDMRTHSCASSISCQPASLPTSNCAHQQHAPTCP
jgi:hypothetical protein